MSVRQATMLAVSTLAAFALGCRDSLSPMDVAGTYVLQRVGNEPVPAVIFRDPKGIVRVIADTLRLTTDLRGSFVFLQVIELAAQDAAPETPVRIEIGFEYRLVGSRIEMSYDCPPNASCLAGPHAIGRRFRRGLLVENAFGDDAIRQYDRVAGLRGF